MYVCTRITSPIESCVWGLCRQERSRLRREQPKNWKLEEDLIDAFTWKRDKLEPLLSPFSSENIFVKLCVIVPLPGTIK